MPVHKKDKTAEFLFPELDEAAEPTFSVSEAAKVFFGKSSHWMRWREESGHFVLDGQPIEVPRTEQGARVYTLPVIERLAHGLAQQGAISGAQLANILMVIESIAKVWGMM